MNKESKQEKEIGTLPKVTIAVGALVGFYGFIEAPIWVQAFICAALFVFLGVIFIGE